MPSPEMDILEILAADDAPLGMAWRQYQALAPTATFAQAQHALFSSITTGAIALLRGATADTAVPVPAWEVRFILADQENWLPPDATPRFWLRLTDQGQRIFAP